MKNLIKVFGIIALVAVIGFSFAACGNDKNGDNGGGNGGGGGAGRLTITGLSSDEVLQVYVYPAGADISTYAAYQSTSNPVEATGSNDGAGNVFELMYFTSANLGQPWRGSGNRPVALGLRWTTVNFTNGNGTVTYSSFTPMTGMPWE